MNIARVTGGERSWRWLVSTALVVSLVTACGDDESSDTTAVTTTTMPSTTTPATTTPATTMPPAASSTAVPPTTPGMGSDVESLSYLIQGLLTTEEIGGGWVDQGRHIIPPGSDQLSGFLCEEGEATVAALDGRADPQVSTTFRRPDDVGLRVYESLMWGDRDQVTADFESLTSAVEGCAGSAYATTDLGELVLSVDTAPDLGTSAVSFRFAPATPPADTPWLEQQTTSVLLSDPEQPVAVVVSVGTIVTHDPPDAATTDVTPDEYDRLVMAAVDRILAGL